MSFLKTTLKRLIGALFGIAAALALSSAFAAFVKMTEQFGWPWFSA